MSDLAAGWVEKLDPSSGRNYYTNASTGETTWTKPTGGGGAAAAAGASSDLAAGWVEKLDPTSGRNYYTNAGTGETTWTKPPSPPGTPGAAAAAAPAAAAGAAVPKKKKRKKKKGHLYCEVCDKEVYNTPKEKVLAMEKIYHRSCFACHAGREADISDLTITTCVNPQGPKTLNLQTYKEWKRLPYCRTCWKRDFGFNDFRG